MEDYKKRYPGTLFLVVGNSGSGKDSIISGAMERVNQNEKILYSPKRYITRPPSETEDNIPIRPEEFEKLDAQGKFSLKWHIYGLHYGVPEKIDEFLKEGKSVVVNVSRTIIPKAREIYENLKVIFIKVPFEITLQRIKERGRESGPELQKRIERAKTHQSFPEADFTVDNSGELQDAIDQFLNFFYSTIRKN
ncbi:MAG: Ribose 1,5-bisphosphate phosphokinase PhnN [Promethearchaeota archaeon]|nr:MAG: Ribose 1,5-bisphosphate phosphokinase PhnN [Candidatus Lokiarchaeota archaeon]